MLIRNAIEVRLSRSPDSRRGVGRLPRTLKADPLAARTAMLQRLAASRLFAWGDRAGVLSSAQRRSGRLFRLDVRQRVVVKALVSRHAGRGTVRAAALAAHIAYLGRVGAGAEARAPEFFDGRGEFVDGATQTCGWSEDRHHFRFIISPEQGERIVDLRRYACEVMRRVSADLGEPGLEWIGVCHHDTAHPHVHVLVRGRRASGRDLVIPRDYIGFGFRARAQEVAQERLGDLSRAEAERRVWRETQADRFTGLDRRLLQAADLERCVDDGVGRSDVWSALTRGRLRRLEALGLAQPVGTRYRLADDLEIQLRGLQLRQDIQRTLHQRRLDAGRNVSTLSDRAVRGRVVARGHHDELGAAPWIVVRDRAGDEHYARLRFGQAHPAVGRTVELLPSPQGAQVRTPSRAADLGR